jgi:hypothetical protein
MVRDEAQIAEVRDKLTRKYALRPLFRPGVTENLADIASPRHGKRTVMTPPSFGKLRCLRTRLNTLSIGAIIAALCATVTGDPVHDKRASPEITVPDPSPAEPVKAAMRMNADKTVAGSRCEVVIRVRIAAGHHIYAMDAAKKPFLPTSLVLKLPEGLETDGEWMADEPTLTKTGQQVYTESVVFRRRCKVRPNVSAGSVFITSKLHYQACNTELCWPPQTINLSTVLAITGTKPTPP